MEHNTVVKELIKKQNVADHLANERTMLAWVRTGIGIIAFGFAVVKFSLFVRQLSLVLGEKMPQPKGYSAEIGIVLVALGTLSILFAYLKYRETDRQLKSGDYQQSQLLIQLLVGLISLIGLVLLAYLIMTNIG